MKDNKENITEDTILNENVMEEKKEVVKLPIGEEQIKKANELLLKYKSGKKSLEDRIINNEKWWRLNQWDQIETVKNSNIKPSSAWLFNCINSKHADAMDSFPEPNFLPRESGDIQEAQTLSSIVPVILEQNKYKNIYSNAWWYKLKNGTSCKGIFWDATKLNGLGDITIRKIDLLNLFWEPGITDIQKSTNIFHTELVDNELLEGKYPELKGKLSGGSTIVGEYAYDDNVDNANKSLVVDWYYHKMIDNTLILQYCKYVNTYVLYATENDMENSGNGVLMCERGLYDHGKYPFIVDVLFPTESSIAGFGYIDICKGPQEYIDRIDKAILESVLISATPRWLVRGDGDINEEEFSDLSKHFIHVPAGVSEDVLRQIQTSPAPSICETIRTNKIDEMKETSGNRDVNNGGTTSGATAASAIAALQEAGGKLSRDMINTTYNAFEEECELIVELIRQFYDIPRQFRIVGKQGEQMFVDYSNEGIMQQDQGNDFGEDMGYRLPVFDIEVQAQKESPYSKISNNELMVQMYQLGVFNPQMADQAVMLVGNMDFKGKNELVQKIQNNGTMYQQMMQMQQQMMQMTQIIDGLTGGQTDATGAMMSQADPTQQGTPPTGGSGQLAENNSMGELKKQSNVTEKAKARTRNTNIPR